MRKKKIRPRKFMLLADMRVEVVFRAGTILTETSQEVALLQVSEKGIGNIPVLQRYMDRGELVPVLLTGTHKRPGTAIVILADRVKAVT